MKLLIIAGARPNFMKIAPVCRELDNWKDKIEYLIVHTGQHYDEKMSDLFINELQIPAPRYNLNVGSDTHSRQVANIMIKFEDVCINENPDAVLVVGDVNSTMACSLVAVKLGIKVIHLEAGLRSFDKSMPEEINRIVTDAIADYYLTPSADADENLLKEGIDKNKIIRVGNIMIDSLLNNIPKAQETSILNKLDLVENNYILVTLHRPSNVDNDEVLSNIFNLLNKVSKKVKIIFPVHPRTLNKIKEFKISNSGNIILTEPLGYFEFLHLESKALLVITDSGGIQEETTTLKVPCITLRENTERPITVDIGTNVVVGYDYKSAEELINDALNNKWKSSEIPELWDGKTAERIVKFINTLI